ncbi:ABC transporter substrate-binding protein [Stenotrophomonas sp. C3(2023)]|uniref:ABC transporter substrate-binding protein n=1 Tax=Stenotrophomonas sp. C3(2023) TaxID=3080277 RepID=UPI00293C8E8E|nr:ABC transporter substrate-binding protein [Stenotrophomonas sp. C3(2023)]MDV3467708.1 ABC transporter substrate-binding protein [Stenotrophomonas sp. C3(2023)]
MRIGTMTLAVATALALGGCGKQAAAASEGRVGSLAVDKPVAGEITSRSPMNYNDGSRYQLYNMDLKEKQVVELKLAGALDGALGVFRDGTVVASSSSGEGNETSLTFRADVAGKYRIAVSGDDASAYGPYRLQAAELVPYDGKPLLNAGDIADVLTTRNQEYTLRVDKAGMYQIDLGSTAFDTVLTLSGNGLEQEDDDGGDRTNSRMNLTLEPGTYTLGVRGIDESASGLFRLNVRQSELPEGLVRTDNTTLPATGSVNLLLSRDGARTFNLVVDRPGQVRLDAISRQVDTVLEVSGNGVSFEDDDGGQGTNARLEMDLRPGRYNVRVSSFQEREGMVELRINRSTGGSGGGDVSAPESDAAEAAQEAQAAADAAQAAGR